MLKKTSSSQRSGFTLLQISILLVVASLVMVSILPSTQSKLTNAQTTGKQLNAVFLAMREYLAAYGMLPCPADASQKTTSASYGVGATGGGAVNDCSGLPSGSITSGGFRDTSAHVAIGMVPFKTLGLGPEAALDSWGRDISYAVDTNATACWASASQTGTIKIYDNGNYVHTVGALVSHGPDGHGAWLPYSGSDTTNSVTRLNLTYAGVGPGAGNTDPDQLVNAHISIGFTQSDSAGSNTGSTPPSSEATAGTTFIHKPPSAVSGAFDDVVVYSNNLWSATSVPSVGYPTMVGAGTAYPANALYPPGTVWSFVLTFSSSVTVNTSGGAPYIALSALLPGGGNSIGTSNVAQATYQSGSGSTQLTFQYTVTLSDTDNNGIVAVAPVVVPTGSSISTNNLCFFPPDLTQVLIGVPPPG